MGNISGIRMLQCYFQDCEKSIGITPHIFSHCLGDEDGVFTTSY